MEIKARNFEPFLEKIAQQMVGLSEGYSSKSKNSLGQSKSGYGNVNQFGPRRRETNKLNINNTISKYRKKADLQPLHKDSSTIRRPTDAATSMKMYKRHKSLSSLEDKRITFSKLRNK